MTLNLYRSDMDPFTPLERRMNSLFRTFLDDLNSVTPASASSTTIIPRSDFMEDKEAYHITADLPGVKKEDVHLEVEQDCVRVYGEMKSNVERKDKDVKYVERRYGKFERVYGLDQQADVNHVKAKFEDGVLQVTIPKKEKQESKKITID